MHTMQHTQLFCSCIYSLINTNLISAGIRKCGMGGAIGLGLSALYAVWNSREKLAELTQFNPA